MFIFLFLKLMILMPGANATEIRVATASNFYPTLNKIKSSYEGITGNKVIIVRGATAKLYAQIKQGKPYDILFAADSIHVDKLVKQGKSINYEKDKNSLVYAIGRLVLWRADVDSSQQLREQLNEGYFNKLAIVNPKTELYGKASVEALKAMELYESVKHKLIYAEHIYQVRQFVESGAADIGIVSSSYANQDIHWEIESYLHRPIKQKAVILKQSKQFDVAREFLQYIQSPAIKKLITSDGYVLD